MRKHRVRKAYLIKRTFKIDSGKTNNLSVAERISASDKLKSSKSRALFLTCNYFLKRRKYRITSL